MDLAQHVLQVFEIVAPGGVLLGQEVFHDVAQPLDADAKPVKRRAEPLRRAWRCSLWASVQRSSARWRNTRLPGRKRAIRRGSDRLQRSHCLRSNSASACMASCCSGISRAPTRLQQRRGDGIAGAVQPVHPLLHHVQVAQFSQAAEEALPCSFHLLPGRIGIEGGNAIRHGTATAKGHTKIVHRVGREGQAGAIAFFEDAVHPESQA